MDAFDSTHYVPVLFTKAGERDALKAIGDVPKTAFTPLLVVHPISWDFDKDAPEKNIDQHLAKLPTELAKTWGERPAFVDAVHIESEVMQDGSHPLEWLIETAAQEGLELVPVVSPDHSAEYLAAARRVLARSSSPEVCLRLPVAHWPVPPADTAIETLLNDLGVGRDASHLVLDLRDQTQPAAAFAVTNALQSLLRPTDWKTLTVAATAMTQLVPNGRGVHQIERAEWRNYVQLIRGGQFGHRPPTFGDYAISHPDPFADVDPRVLQISAKLKYTADDDWLVARGGLFKGNAGRSGGGVEIRAVARELVARGEFTAGHCGAEDWIVAAAGSGPTGAPRTWVKIGTWHHVLRVLNQISRM